MKNFGQAIHSSDPQLPGTKEAIEALHSGDCLRAASRCWKRRTLGRRSNHFSGGLEGEI